MKLAKIISFLGILAMTGVISWAFISGDFVSEGAILLAMPWGIVSMVDLYVGFILFSMWIVYREKAVLPSIIWVFLMLTLGFFTGSLYTFIALQKSGGSWQQFWHGKRLKNK
ncbi:MAG: DUF1475 domain-containing protein [Chloroflexi bacterium HGW-Chloroflexi-5]|jgi:hypothetical protein|nr:MAG: DUF1475 domain-containing protein [Chloroflexi bacterium HGW-Chloroflexi-5]